MKRPGIPRRKRPTREPKVTLPTVGDHEPIPDEYRGFVEARRAGTPARKRSLLLRKKPLSRSGPPKRANPKRQAKRRKTYAQKLAAYRRSETYKLVEERAAGRCEAVNVVDVDGLAYAPNGPHRVEWRCFAREGLSHHHKTYARFGGRELPEDVVVFCKRHHAIAESQFPNRRNNHRKAS